MDTVSIAELTQEAFYLSVSDYAVMAALVYDTHLTLEDEHDTALYHKQALHIALTL
ncbi:hypothetical protein M422DRAFT_259767 [Sphaerobolus stellatus SS14]|uniref:Uncharacterized protein n=1 Tax=Sphaerobolus stellatus (strain SS14) TaxID=990650 RepID=A0A0C9VJ79_SPHS4|nr:hypothetical protein M422DRAFT_259767 [Sphaerobolus stellatus SS14]